MTGPCPKGERGMNMAPGVPIATAGMAILHPWSPSTVPNADRSTIVPG